jgi:hypothetical protein
MDWYIDPVNGSYANSGDSPTVTLAGADGVGYGTTKFTSAEGGFTGKAGRYIKISSLYKLVTVVSDTEVTLDGTVPSGSGKSFVIGGPVLSPNILSSSRLSNGDRFKYPKTADCDAVSAGALT